MTPGRVVLLNGTSSSGKTTLAEAWRDERAGLGELWLIIGIDDVLSKLPITWLDLGAPFGPGPLAADGMRFVVTGQGTRLVIGGLARRLLDQYQGWVAAAAHGGFDVVVDDVVVDEQHLASWRLKLQGLDVTWVKVHCPREMAQERERARGDRPLGMAGAQHDVVHHDIPYDAEIDTARLSPSEGLDALRAAVGR